MTLPVISRVTPGTVTIQAMKKLHGKNYAFTLVFEDNEPIGDALDKFEKASKKGFGRMELKLIDDAVKKQKSVRTLSGYVYDKLPEKWKQSAETRIQLAILPDTFVAANPNFAAMIFRMEKDAWEEISFTEMQDPDIGWAFR